MTRKKSVLFNEKEKKSSDCVKRGEKCLFCIKLWLKRQNGRKEIILNSFLDTVIGICKSEDACPAAATLLYCRCTVGECGSCCEDVVNEQNMLALNE